ncbi:unnamed protein product [Amoebophrya sp. A25]|nr:unnamed protein product [Amoebophrya sp. A25]|eukprot:GSA25T00010016001.1
MAITSLAERKAFAAMVGTTDKVGPGSYGGHQSYDFLQTCAPFTSTSARMPDPARMAAPDPTAYSPAKPNKKKQFPGLAVPFATSQARLQTRRRSLGRGPASYDVGSAVEADDIADSKTMGRPKENRKMEFIKKSRYTRPSIPKPNQAFGYGEGPGGVLVKQDPPMAVSGGDGADRIGPDHYSLTDGITRAGPKTVPGGKFPGGIRKGLASIKDIPGPGHYQNTTSMKRKHVTPGSSFKSQTMRGVRIGDAEEEPGPGQYTSESSSSGMAPSKKAFSRGDYQFFGSTARRFPQRSKEVKPGPGAYTDFPNTIATSAQTVSNFARDGARWKEGGLFETKPGPGTYNASNTDGFFGWQNQDSLAMDNQSAITRSFSLMSNQGTFAFGTTARRFKHREPAKSAEELAIPKTQDAPNSSVDESGEVRPGPGAYILPSSFKTDDKTSAAFQKPLRKSDKFATSETKPPPGTYSPRLPNQVGRVARVPPRSEGFLGSTRRFHELPTDQKPGPGTYKQQKKPPKELKAGFSCSIDRFAGVGRGIGPGPGAYRREIEWGGKSYNILFSREV